MRSVSQTRKSSHRTARVDSTYSWNGQQVDVHDSARNGVLIIELFQDEELQPDEKVQLLVGMELPDSAEASAIPGDQSGELVIPIVWEAVGLDISEDQQDASEHEQRVLTSQKMMGAYGRESTIFGMDWDEASR